MSTPAPTSPVTPVTPPPDIPAVTPPPVTPVTPPPVTPVTPPPVTPVTPPPVTPVTPPPVIPVTPPPVIPTPTTPTPSPLPPTATPTPVSPLPLPPPRPTPTPTPVTPSQPPPRPAPTPTPATPSSPPPPRQTPTPTPVTPSPSPPRPTPTPTPATPSTPPPPSQTPPEAPASPPPPDDVPPSLSPPNGVPASPVPPPSPLSSWSPPPPPQSAGAPSTSASSSSPSSGTAVGVGVAVGAVVMLGLVAALIFFFVARRRRRRRLPPPGTPADFFYDPRQPVTPLQQSHAPSRAPSSTPPLMHSWQSSSGGPPGSPLRAMSGGTFAYDELAAAADWFSDANLLGQGGFGHVYKGTVRGQEVAIKKLRAGRGQGHREFRAEVDIISRVHHKNLVSLVGFCIHGEQRLLVYEYVPNKTLESHLHHGSGRPALDWPRRWKIAVGSAKGLAYLHEDCHPKIIHRDIKAANILLDYNYEPKVADFGLAKCQEAGHTTAGVSTRVMGTFGYLAPEYAATGKVNDRSDVFSFGVMLLELITGRKPIMTSSDHQPETLVSWGRPLLTRAVEEGNYEELIDPRLETNYDAYDMARLIACAAAAVRQTARSRPRMSQIVRYLEGELSAEDLNAGMAPGQSAMHRSSGGSATDEIRRLRKMAFGPGVGTGGTISECASSELSEPTSEYGVNPSSEYTTSSAADTGEMTDVEAQRTSGAGRSAAEGAGGTERLGRRATVSRQARRASRG